MEDTKVKILDITEPMLHYYKKTTEELQDENKRLTSHNWDMGQILEEIENRSEELQEEVREGEIRNNSLFNELEITRMHLERSYMEKASLKRKLKEIETKFENLQQSHWNHFVKHRGILNKYEKILKENNIEIPMELILKNVKRTAEKIDLMEDVDNLRKIMQENRHFHNDE